MQLMIEVKAVMGQSSRDILAADNQVVSTEDGCEKHTRLLC